MAFDEVRLPQSLSYGAIGGPGFRTRIITLESGHERRDRLWTIARAVYNIGPLLNSQERMETIRNFFYERQGRLRGFRFKDCTDFNLIDQTIALTDGTTTTFQITKTYGQGPTTYVRNINKPVINTVVVQVNDININEGSGNNEYQIDLTSGIITLGSSLAASVGDDIDVTCEFDVPVRFETDVLEISADTFDHYSWDVELVEVLVS